MEQVKFAVLDEQPDQEHTQLIVAELEELKNPGWNVDSW